MRHRKRLAGTGDAHERLKLAALRIALNDFIDRLWLIALGLEGADDLELGHESSQFPYGRCRGYDMLCKEGWLMTVTIPTIQLTAEDLLKMPDEAAFELVDGSLVERHMGAESGEIAARILVLIGMFLRDHRLGRLFSSETGYQ